MTIEINTFRVGAHTVSIANDRAFGSPEPDAWKYKLDFDSWSPPFDNMSDMLTTAVERALRDVVPAHRGEAERCCFRMCDEPAAHRAGGEIYFPLCHAHYAEYTGRCSECFMDAGNTDVSIHTVDCSHHWTKTVGAP